MATSEDWDLLEEAHLSRNVKFVTQSALSSLEYLHGLSERLGIPIDQITPKQIIDDARAVDAQLREAQMRIDSQIGGKL